MITKIYKIEVMVVDHENRFFEDVVSGLENCKYIYPRVISSAVREVEWSDGHPLNNRTTSKQSFENLFSDEDDHAREEYSRALDQAIDFG